MIDSVGQAFSFSSPLSAAVSGMWPVPEPVHKPPLPSACSGGQSDAGGSFSAFSSSASDEIILIVVAVVVVVVIVVIVDNMIIAAAAAEADEIAF